MLLNELLTYGGQKCTTMLQTILSCVNRHIPRFNVSKSNLMTEDEQYGPLERIGNACILWSAMHIYVQSKMIWFLPGV